ncbi:hypothetical protein ACFBZI_05845 [Moraxella sp. ZJ142]|uniref:hypothetical protein n=1 Tax=Moraxella marmotae TaxID=3344520 RepID=UPI0035D43A3E
MKIPQKSLLSKLLLASALAVASVSTAMPALASTFSAAKMSQTVVNSLSFKDVMRALYAGRMVQTYINDEELEKYPYIGLSDRPLYYWEDDTTEDDDEEYRLLALMHPVATYQNHQGKTRHLVMIEKVMINDEGNLLISHGLGAEVDLYIFERLPSGKYQLISRTDPKHGIEIGAWGRSGLQMDEMAPTIQPMGKSLTGGIFEFGYCGGGSCDLGWWALHLNEDRFIDRYYVGDSGGNNSGLVEEYSPLAYDYKSTWRVIDNGATHFPIELHFTGEMPMDDGAIQEVDFRQNMFFNPAKREYQ